MWEAVATVMTTVCAKRGRNRRSHNPEGPSPEATNTISLPSGERANENGSVVGGVLISVRTSLLGTKDPSRKCAMDSPSRAVTTPDEIAVAKSCRLLILGTELKPSASASPCQIH